MAIRRSYERPNIETQVDFKQLNRSTQKFAKLISHRGSRNDINKYHFLVSGSQALAQVASRDDGDEVVIA